MSLRIGIVGAGLGGLAAAIALRRQGHEVDVFESSTFSKEIGAALVVPPNALLVLKSLGCRVEALRGVDIMAFTAFSHKGGPGIPSKMRDTLEAYGNRYISSYRIDIHNELKRMAFEQEGGGPPARLHLAHKAATCDPALGHLLFTNGEHYEGDLIIGADGIRSTIRTAVMEREVVAPPSGYAAFRWLIETSKLDGNPDLDWVYRDGVSGPRMVSVRSKVLFLYPCRDGTLINAVLLHSDARDQEAFDWTVPATRAELLSHATNFHPQFQAFMKLAPEDLSIWQLRTLPPLERYVRDRVALLGDAAHAMFPSLGQGAALAIEDGVTLGRLFPLGTKKSDVSDRLQLYDRLRRPRDEFIRRESFEQATVPEKRGLFASSTEMQDIVFGFDALNVPIELPVATPPMSTDSHSSTQA